MACGRVFSIEEFSVFDGPGIRTTVFLKGCKLHCSWCHNPEGQSFEPQVLRSPNGCKNCGRCTELAKKLTGKEKLVPECIKVCPEGLIRISGETYTSEELTEKIIKNKVFYKSDGGVTFSGGEPLAQSEFLLECLKLLKGKVNRCIQTAGDCDKDVFSEVLKETDYVLFDIKLADKEKLKRYTGADAEKVYSNFDILVKSGVPFTVRIPLIPGVTDTEENFCDIAVLLNKYGIKYAEALPYNKLAGSKYLLSGREYMPDFDEKKEPVLRREIFKQYGIEIKKL